VISPAEITSKRPVTRKRTVVEAKSLVSSTFTLHTDSNSEIKQARDPRFLPLSGQFSATKFQEQYGFLSELHSTELTTLRGNLRRARKLLESSPQNLRAEREQEVRRLELAMKKAESLVNRDARDRIERDALNEVMKAEADKRKQGKRDWWMKKCTYPFFLAVLQD
jgi:ribosomal RNA-processing protein 36